eukprot:CAMPEP_0167784160 /NCGR_PEP_ID=MMETSP0111_2-20121227/7481_1 /TAXON_ID=91324 /ORGANISM="Lotharella globosa, Strain CCCM811" /LENGTH=92 /DNA_ID=CAMNT_0007675197 /DNA_START=1 /DNA_END=280 /DNA_ORIENTATION=+
MADTRPLRPEAIDMEEDHNRNAAGGGWAPRMPPDTPGRPWQAISTWQEVPRAGRRVGHAREKVMNLWRPGDGNDGCEAHCGVGCVALPVGTS